MFGIDTNTLLLMALLAMAAGAAIWAVFFNKISNERNQERRVKSIKRNEGDRNVREKIHDI